MTGKLAVTAPDGVEWTVVRRVLPWRPRLRRDPSDIDPAGLILQLLSLPFLLLELFAAGMIQLLLVALRRPWRVEATAAHPRQRLVWRIRGFAAAGEHARAVAAAIAATGDGPTSPDQRDVG